MSEQKKSSSRIYSFWMIIAVLVTLYLMSSQAAQAIDATDFGYNKMRAVGVRPLLVIMAPTSGGPALAHDAAFYSKRIWGPLGGGQAGDRSVLDYFAEVSNGSLLIGNGGIIGPFQIPTGGDFAVRQAALQAAAGYIDSNFHSYDRNGDNAITPDELNVLVITNLPLAQTSLRPHQIMVNGKNVSVMVSGVGDTANLNITTHEITHQFGAVDLYGTRWLSCQLTLMSCSFDGPDAVTNVYLDPWHKMQFGWIKPRIHDIRTAGAELLQAPQVAATGLTSNESPVILYDPRRGTGEFFMLEHRNPTAPGKYDESAASSGLAIWQIKQDAVKQLVLVPDETNPGGPMEPAGFVRGAPSWSQGGNTLYRFNNGDINLKWLDGTASGFIARPWLQSSDGRNMPVNWTGSYAIYHLNGPSFNKTPGILSQIAVGTNAVWGVNPQQQVYRFDFQTQLFEQLPGILRQIAVGNANSVWGINPSGSIYRFDGTSFVQVPGSLFQISVGSDGSVWGINSSALVYRFNFNSQTFEQVPGILRQIAVGNANEVWGVNPAGQIYRFNGTRFVQIPGILEQIAVGGDGAVWGINPQQQIFRFNPGTQLFEQIPGILKQISVGRSDTVWGINPSGLIFHFNGTSFVQAPGILSQIATGGADVWGLN